MADSIKKQIRASLADENLQAALSRFTSLTKLGRQMGMAGIDFEALRRDIRCRKERAIEDMPELIQRFKENATSAGAIVYEAKNAADANRYVTGLARSQRVRHIVKSKSMLTEELDLRESLEHAGIRVDETDIGERIVQLAHERPAHIVGPAIHKTVEQISDLFTMMTGKQVGTDSQELLDTVRDTLRHSYLDADMGISGANMLLADTGTFAILTNEGNGQIVTTLSPLHVAVVGIEKIIHDFEDANAILRLLSRSCVGTKMTVYVSFITGASNVGHIGGLQLPGGQGPQQLHIVLVDNGRNELRDSPVFREALYCIKCGVCLNVCPVFASVAGQTYGHVYQGGIGTILTAFYHDPERARELSGMCMGCMACKAVCPVMIDIPNLIREYRKVHVEKSGLPINKKIVYQGILKHPQITEAAVSAGASLQRPFVDKDGIIRKLPYPLKDLTGTLALPALSPHRLRDRMAACTQPPPGNKPIVAFYAGCITAFAYPELGEKVMKLLKSYNCAPYYPAGQACCGAPSYFSGDSGSALALARHNIEAFMGIEADRIATVCPGCAVMLKKEYPSLTSGDQALHEKSLKLAEKVRDISELVVELAERQATRPKKGRKVTYHDPCHLKRGLGIAAEPRQMILDAGYELVEMNDADACCGFGGDALLTHPELCGSILKRKLANIEATGVDTVVTACTACILQLRGGLDKKKSPIKVIHVAELFAD
jgi:iron-sulfur cluster protein